MEYLLFIARLYSLHLKFNNSLNSFPRTRSEAFAAPFTPGLHFSHALYTYSAHIPDGHSDITHLTHLLWHRAGAHG